MPLYILLGHGTHHVTDGHFTLPSNVQLDFILPDGHGLEDETAQTLEHYIAAGDSDLSAGLSDAQIHAASVHHFDPLHPEKRLKRETVEPGKPVKNYLLESVVGASGGVVYVEALKKKNVWTPGIPQDYAGDNAAVDGNSVTYLQTLALELSEQHAGEQVRIEWVACRSERNQTRRV